LSRSRRNSSHGPQQRGNLPPGLDRLGRIAAVLERVGVTLGSARRLSAVQATPAVRHRGRLAPAPSPCPRSKSAAAPGCGLGGGSPEAGRPDQVASGRFAIFRYFLLTFSRLRSAPGSIALMPPIGRFVTVNVRTDANLPGRRGEPHRARIRMGRQLGCRGAAARVTMPRPRSLIRRSRAAETCVNSGIVKVQYRLRPYFCFKIG
jgi:hypothetical protein